MSEQLRPTLWAVFLALLVMIWFKWQAANAPAITNDTNSNTATPPTLVDQANTATPNSTGTVPNINAQSGSGTQTIKVKTPEFETEISLIGGNLVSSKLVDYHMAIDDATPFPLLENTPGKRFTIESGLVSNTGDLLTGKATPYQSAADSYELTGDTLTVPLIYEANGVRYEKLYTFSKESYEIKLTQKVTNNSEETWKGTQYRQINRDRVDNSIGLGQVYSYTGGVYSTEQVNYKKYDFDDMADTALSIEATGGWIAMIQHYFLVAIVPTEGQKNQFYTQTVEANNFNLGMSGASRTLESGQATSYDTTLYVGPKIKGDLKALSPNLEKAVDYGFLFFISDALFYVLRFIHNILGNWGWAIVVTTLLIKACFFPLAAKSFKSMAKMRAAQPQLEKIKNMYKDDRQKQGQEMMKLYKKEGINPASGCLPILLQIPVFLAFYFMLNESVELRQAPWILWIHDLSVRDPFFVLPVINTVLMFFQQKLNPPPADPMQRKVMQMLPLIFGVLFLMFPSGLVLYWSVSNLFSIAQQYVINKKYGVAH